MPELPDLTVYVEQLSSRILGHRLLGIRITTPFLLRSVEPPIEALVGHRVRSLDLLGKRIVIAFEGELFLLLHLMVSGRLHWKDAGAKVPGRVGLCAFDFESGSLLLTEASRKRRASLHLVRGRVGLAAFDRGGLPVLTAGPAAFREALLRESHTLNRALCDPALFSGIGNAYSDEILHRARLSPVQLTRNLEPPEIERLYQATRETLGEWTERLRSQAGREFPEHVTAFREEMAVHGRYGKPCPRCGAPVQRIVYADNETNYCAPCQTGGKLLADRALSRLLKGEWPRSLEELEELREAHKQRGGGKVAGPR
jgi:formamidopyrimidine-DNA glycosylase